jgi:hypothetical protein
MDAVMNARQTANLEDPFGSLTDWGPVVDQLRALEAGRRLDTCQPGLIRILRHKGNWRLREETLKRVGKIEAPSADLILQVLSILADDNLYYDARILAGDALMGLLGNTHDGLGGHMKTAVRKVVTRLMTSPQPPRLLEALKTLGPIVDLPPECAAGPGGNRIDRQEFSHDAR